MITDQFIMTIKPFDSVGRLTFHMVKPDMKDNRHGMAIPTGLSSGRPVIFICDIMNNEVLAGFQSADSDSDSRVAYRMARSAARDILANENQRKAG